MANQNAPLGFQYRGTISGVANGQTIVCYVPASDNTAIYIGDAVTATNTTDSTYGVPIVEQAGASDVIMGVCIGTNPILGVAIGSENLNRIYRPASTGMYIYVMVDPAAEYEIQSSATVASSDMNKYANLTAAVSGSTFSGRSGMQLNEASVTATKAGAQMLIVSTLQTPDNAPTAANTRLIVRLVNQLTSN